MSTHVEANLLNVSLWRDDMCVGTARLRPDDVAQLVEGLTEGLATLASRPRALGADAADLAALEARLSRLEQARTPSWRRATGAVAGWAVRRAARAGCRAPSA